MKPIKIPKLFHELFGQQTTVIELVAILLFTVLSSMILFWASYPEWQGLEWYQILLIILLALDIMGGVIANVTFSTNEYYKERPKLRYVFIAIHIQPLLLSFILGKYYLPGVLIWLYTVLCALIVNACYRHPAQRTIAAALTALGMLWFSVVYSMLPVFLFVLLLFFLIKVSFSFPVDHFAERQA